MGFKQNDVRNEEWEVVEAVAKLMGKNPHWVANFGTNRAEDRHIRSWDLRSAGLKVLPENIGNLIMLETLDLGANMIREVPPSFGKLVNLRKLTINSDVLFPPELFQLTNLIQLSTSDKGSLGGSSISGKDAIQRVLLDKFAEGYYVLRLRRSIEYLRPEDVAQIGEVERKDLASRQARW